MHEMTILKQTTTGEAVAGKANFSALTYHLPRNCDDSSRAASATRDGIVFLLLLLVAEIVLHYCSKRNPHPSFVDGETAPGEDEGPALPGPHIDANTRMHHPRISYDWVRASNSAVPASEASEQQAR